MLASDAVVLMPTPTVESWLGHGMLRPWGHYVPLDAPAEAEERIAQLEATPRLAHQMRLTANAYMRNVTCGWRGQTAAVVRRCALTKPEELSALSGSLKLTRLFMLNIQKTHTNHPRQDGARGLGSRIRAAFAFSLNDAPHGHDHHRRSHSRRSPPECSLCEPGTSTGDGVERRRTGLAPCAAVCLSPLRHTGASQRTHGAAHHAHAGPGQPLRECGARRALPHDP